jgi:hypothetical protein
VGISFFWKCENNFTTFTPMRKKLTTTKVTSASLYNFKIASSLANRKQYDVIEEASKDVLKKISTKIKTKKP